jgi:hypothetical protein
MTEDSILQSILIIFSILVAIFTGIWAYARYILERSLLPSIQPDLICNVRGVQDDKRIIEILLHLKNVGPSTLVVNNINLDFRYISANDPKIRLFGEKEGEDKGEEKITYGNKVGLLKFPHSLKDSLTKEAIEAAVGHIERREKNAEVGCKGRVRGLPLAQGSTFFVQPGVDQIFTFITGLPSTATFLLVHGEFCYIQNMNAIKKILLYTSQKLGLIQFTLGNVRYPHTIERVFNIGS